MAAEYRQAWDDLARKDALTAIYGAPDSPTTLEQFDAAGKAHADMLRQFMPPNPLTLDLGCGIGRIEKFLAPYCEHIHAVDASGEMVKRAKERLAGLDNVTVHQGNGADLGLFGDETFDFAWSLLVLQHMAREDAFIYLSEIFRVLKPGGVAVFQFPGLTMSFYFEQDFLVRTRMRLLSPARVRLYTVPEVRHFLTYLGYEILVFSEGTDPRLMPDEICAVVRRPSVAEPRFQIPLRTEISDNHSFDQSKSPQDAPPKPTPVWQLPGKALRMFWFKGPHAVAMSVGSYFKCVILRMSGKE
jgi:ubiquinone/menaquinone biosynthesis C-methylase UbiE